MWTQARNPQPRETAEKSSAGESRRRQNLAERRSAACAIRELSVSEEGNRPRLIPAVSSDSLRRSSNASLARYSGRLAGFSLTASVSYVKRNAFDVQG